MTWKFTSISFSKEEDLGAKEANEWRPEAQKGVTHAAKESGRVAHLSWPSGLRLFAFFAPTLRSFQKLMLVNFQVIRTSFGSLKHQNIENRVFYQCRVNSRKIGKL